MFCIPEGLQLYWRVSLTHVFDCEFYETFMNTYFLEDQRTTASVNIKKYIKSEIAVENLNLFLWVRIGSANITSLNAAIKLSHGLVMKHLQIIQQLVFLMSSSNAFSIVKRKCKTSWIYSSLSHEYFQKDGILRIFTFSGPQMRSFRTILDVWLLKNLTWYTILTRL